MNLHFNLRVLVLAFASLVVSPGCRFKVEEVDTVEQVSFTAEEQESAATSVRAFLKELDDEQGHSWELFSQATQAAVSKSMWSVTVTGFRTVFGKNLGRGNAQFGCTERLEDAPPGRYFVFDIESKFERADLTERVVLVKEGSQWKIAGYFRTKTVSFQDDAKKT